MDCESCGRYRPSAEIAPIRMVGGDLVMVCARCRRLVTSRRGKVLGQVSNPTAAASVSIAIDPR